MGDGITDGHAGHGLFSAGETGRGAAEYVGTRLHRVTAAGQGLPVQPLCDQCCVILIKGDSGGAFLVQQTGKGAGTLVYLNRRRSAPVGPGGKLGCGPGAGID